jgi:hypothetical protein
MNAANDQTERAAALVDLLLQSLKELAAAGQAEAACQLAGRACAVLRHEDPKGWQKFNALLHRLTKRPAAASTIRD